MHARAEGNTWHAEQGRESERPSRMGRTTPVLVRPTAAAVMQLVNIVHAEECFERQCIDEHLVVRQHFEQHGALGVGLGGRNIECALRQVVHRRYGQHAHLFPVQCGSLQCAVEAQVQFALHLSAIGRDEIEQALWVALEQHTSDGEVCVRTSTVGTGVRWHGECVRVECCGWVLSLL